MPEPFHVKTAVFRTGDKDRVISIQRPGSCKVVEINEFVTLERIEVRKIGDVRQSNDANVYFSRFGTGRRVKQVIKRQAVFRVYFDVMKVWNESQDGKAGFAFDEFDARSEKIRVAAEAVDDDARHPPSVFFWGSRLACR